MADSPCTTVLRAEWDTCDHIARFETWATLYYLRFRRLSPGKSEPRGFASSSDYENVEQCADWHASGLAKHDAIMALAAALASIEKLERRIEDLEVDNG